VTRYRIKGTILVRVILNVGIGLLTKLTTNSPI